MIEITERQISDSEKKILLDRIPSKDKRTESAVVGFILILGIFLVPLLLIDKYWFDVPSNIELISLIPILIITAYLTHRLDRKSSDPKYIKSDIKAGIVTVYNIKTDRVIKMRDSEDFGPGYYIDLGQNNEYKTLFLFGQYLDDFENKKFPSTEFQLIKGKGGQVINIIPMGEYLKPIRTLKAYSKQDFKDGKVPDDGQLLTMSLDQVLE